MDHEARFQDEPGQRWGAKRQCEVLLRDKDATLLNPDKLQVGKGKNLHFIGFRYKMLCRFVHDILIFLYDILQYLRCGYVPAL
jgi:hypothetical protein